MDSTKFRLCPICHSDRTKFLFESWDLWHGYPGAFPVWACKACGHVFLVGNFTPEMLTDLYSNYYPRSQFDVEQYKPYTDRKGFLSWLDGDSAGCHRWVPKNVRVLDIGCGCCETLGYHKARGCEVWGCEADENVRAIADKFGFNVHIGLFDPDNYEKDYFDYVTMNHVLEHCVDPEKTLQQVYAVLKPGGKLIVGMPQPYCIERFLIGRYWLGWHTPFHLNIFSKQSSHLLLEKAGFRPEFSRCQIPSVNLLNQWAFLFIHGEQGKPMRFRPSSWIEAETFDGELERLWYVRLYRFLEKSRAFALPVRFADALGIGMNRIYIATKPF
jgi:SAM-dependent methyltransferase